MNFDEYIDEIYIVENESKIIFIKIHFCMFPTTNHETFYIKSKK